MAVVIAELDGREIGRYDIQHGGWAGRRGHTPASEGDLYVEARRCLREDGYSEDDAARTIMRMA